MTYGEAIRLSNVIAADPGSRLFAAINGWRYPMERTALVLADLFDAFVAANSSKRQKAYPRPWDKRGKQARQMGTPMSVSEFEAIRAKVRGADSREVNLGR